MEQPLLRLSGRLRGHGFIASEDRHRREHNRVYSNVSPNGSDKRSHAVAYGSSCRTRRSDGGTVSLDAGVRRLEAQVHPGEIDLSLLKEWAQTLDLDDLRCVAALSDDPDIRTRPPEGMTVEAQRARARAVLEAAPEHIRALFAGSEWLKA
jgi:hypothetical protein